MGMGLGALVSRCRFGIEALYLGFAGLGMYSEDLDEEKLLETKSSVNKVVSLNLVFLRFFLFFDP